MTIVEFIERTGLSMECSKAASNPQMIDPTPGMHHWECILVAGAKRMVVPFSMGSALRGAPTLDSVLDCLASDSSSVENAADFEDWAGDLGYDPDSRKAERTYNICKEQAAALRRLLGDAHYDELINDVERL